MTDVMTEQSSTDDRFAELAALGAAVLEAEARIAELSRENPGLHRMVARAQRQTNLSEGSTASQARLNAAQEQVRAQTLDLERLTQAVADKERARFGLQEEIWALSEALSEIEERDADGSDEVGPSTASYIRDVVRLTQLLRSAEQKLKESERKVGEMMLELKATKASATTAPADAGALVADSATLTELRAQMTRIVADRDRALLQAGGRR